MSVYPILALPARCGGVPYLTSSHIRQIAASSELVLVLSMIDGVICCDVVRSSAAATFSEFCGLPEYATLLAVRSTIVGAAEMSLCFDSACGKVSVTSTRLIQLISVLRPTFVIPLHDRSPADAAKRTDHSVLACAKEAASIPSTFVIPVYLGCDPPQSHSSIAVVNVNCYESPAERETHLARLVRQVPSSCLCFVPCDTVTAIINAAKKSPNIVVETALPLLLAERGIALNFSIDPIDRSGADGYCNLWDAAYRTDSSPLSSFGCHCPTCSRHSRAYIHHLLVTQEMNAQVLLAIHNVAFVLQLLRHARKSTSKVHQALVGS